MNTISSAHPCFRACVAAFALLGSSFFVDAAVAAAPSGEPPQQTVRFADLNLEQAAAVATLYQRVNSAARTVCESMDGPGVAAYERFRSCVAQSTARAVEKVGNPALTAYYNARSGHTVARVASAD